MTIYIIRNRVNSFVYIGLTKRTVWKRWQEHYRSAKRGTDRRLYRAMQKHGIENFYYDILYQNDTMSYENLHIAERLFVEQFNSYWFGYNDTLGGSGKLNTIRPKRGR